MANVNIPASSLVNNGTLADPAGTSFTASGNVGVLPSGKLPERMMLRITGGGSAGNLVLKAGANPPYPSSSLGDMTVAFGASGTVWAGPFTSARFTQADGTMTFTASQNCTVTALCLPSAPAGPRG